MEAAMSMSVAPHSGSGAVAAQAFEAKRRVTMADENQITDANADQLLKGGMPAAAAIAAMDRRPEASPEAIDTLNEMHAAMMARNHFSVWERVRLGVGLDPMPGRVERADEAISSLSTHVMYFGMRYGSDPTRPVEPGGFMNIRDSREFLADAAILCEKMVAALEDRVLAWASPGKIQMLESAVQVTRSQILGRLQLIRRQMGFNLPYSMNSRQRNTVVWFKEKLPKMEAALARLDAAR
jgi:hypothetical protein